MKHSSEEAKMIHRILRVGFAAGVLVFSTPGISNALVFNITNQGAASVQMMDGMAQAAALWSARLSNPVTLNVRINAVALPAGQLGSTNAFYDSFAYSDVRAALVNEVQSA